jgi:glycosyltransferase involved in cell wall biosynthesis
VLADQGYSIDIVAVDDGSLESISAAGRAFTALRSIKSIEVIRLVCNLGHQRAIAVGLAEIYSRTAHDVVCVMDSDGEDRPEDIVALIEAHVSDPPAVVVAERGERSEGATFWLFYQTYKKLFALLTGQTISFGNFCLLPFSALERVVFSPDLWNHLAASLLKSRLPLRRIRLPRGTRFAGHSKMSFVPLVAHGLSAVSAFSETMFIRTFLFALGISALAVIGLFAVFILRLGTDLAIPGWASMLSALFMVILLQALMLSAAAAFMILGRRTTPGIIPARDALRYVRDKFVLATT